ncbi:MAG: type III-B CRISPR module-associated protein Cmr5, partial [Thermodesulfovibrionales bacterium]|nr:type III-B CRISPR module-associated protein Cmr5 [Thermodesulfovibrionales bacterium]
SNLSVLSLFLSKILVCPYIIITHGTDAWKIKGYFRKYAFVYAKKRGGNAYDLIYKQFTDYLKSNSTARIKMPQNQNELVEWVISLNSYEYRYVAEELLALLNWLRKFAEGMIEAEEEE